MISFFRFKLLFLISCFFVISSLGRATPLETQPVDPAVDVKVPSSYYLRRFFLMPFDLPAYVLKGATWPLVVGAKFVERHELVPKIIRLLSNEERTLWVYPLIEAGTGVHWGFGAGLKHSDLFDKKYSLSVQGLVFRDADFKAGLQFITPPEFSIDGRSTKIVFKVKSFREADEDFFGIGNSSHEHELSEFGITRVQGGVFVEHHLPLNFRLGFHLMGDGANTWPSNHISNPGSLFDPKSLPQRQKILASKKGPQPSMSFLARHSENRPTPSVDQFFFRRDLPGFRKTLTYLDVGFTLSHNTLTPEKKPQSGGLRRFSFHRFQGLGDAETDYHEVQFELEQVIDLGKPRRNLTFRNAWVFQQSTGGGEIPFYRLATLDVNSPLRAFDRGRFRDTGSVVFNVEYRYPIWDYLDAILFFDTGRVFHGVRDFRFDDFKYAGGAGIEVVTPRSSLVRIQGAYGAEGFNFLLTAGQEW